MYIHWSICRLSIYFQLIKTHNFAWVFFYFFLSSRQKQTKKVIYGQRKYGSLQPAKVFTEMPGFSNSKLFPDSSRQHIFRRKVSYRQITLSECPIIILGSTRCIDTFRSIFTREKETTHLSFSWPSVTGYTRSWRGRIGLEEGAEGRGTCWSWWVGFRNVKEWMACKRPNMDTKSSCDMKKRLKYF